MDLYGEIILDHFKHPRHSGEMESPNLQAEDANTVCGDSVKIFLKADNDGLITDFSFVGDGCAISVASTSLLGEKIIGRKLAAVLDMKQEDVLELLGVPISPGRIKCALLGYSCLKKAARLYQSKTNADAPQKN